MRVTDLGTMPYREAWAAQELAHAEVVAGGEEQLLLVEHPPVSVFWTRQLPAHGSHFDVTSASQRADKTRSVSAQSEERSASLDSSRRRLDVSRSRDTTGWKPVPRVGWKPMPRQESAPISANRSFKSS